MDPFVDSRLRLNRAQEHFTALRSEVIAWLKRRTYSISIRRDLDAGEDVAELGEVEPVPVNLGLVASEIVQHFRSALDNAIHALTIAHSGQVMKGTEFPVFIDQKGFNDQGKVKMRGVSPACQAFIESVQPFHKNPPDEHILWAVHELSNASKHQSLPVLEIFRQVENTTISPVGDLQVIGVKYAPPGPLKSGTEIARWTTRVASEGQVKVDFKLARGISLDVTRPPVLQRQLLVESLKLMGDVTAGIIRQLQVVHNTPPAPSAGG